MTRNIMKHALPLLSRAAVLAAAVLLYAPAAPAAESVDVPGAGGVTVNGAEVSKEQIWDEYNFQFSLKSFIHAKPVDVINTKLLRSVIEQAVNRELLDQEARRLGYVLTDEDRREARRRQVESWKGERNMGTAIKMMRINEEFLIERAASKMLRQKFASGEAAKLAEPTDDELRDFYEDNLRFYLPEEMPPLRYVHVPAETGRNLLEVFRTMAKEANELRKEGRSYLPIIKEYSRHESAARGGVVDGPQWGSERLRQKAGGLADCGFTNYAGDPTGLHMYFRDCRVPIPFAEAKDRVRDDLKQQRKDQLMRETLDRLLAGAEVVHLPLEGPPPLSPGPEGH